MEIDRNHAENLGRPLFLYFYFGERVIFLGKLASPCAKTCFFFGGCPKNFFGYLFFFFFWRTLAPCVFGLGLERVRLENSGLWPWLSDFFVSVAMTSKVVSSTPPLPTTSSDNDWVESLPRYHSVDSGLADGALVIDYKYYARKILLTKIHQLGPDVMQYFGKTDALPFDSVMFGKRFSLV